MQAPHGFYKKLVANGFTEEQAEGLTEAHTEFFSEILEKETKFIKVDFKSELATKNDVQEVKEDVQNVREELKNNIQNVREELKNDIYFLKGDNKLLKWMVGFGISLNLVTLGVMLAFLFSISQPNP